MSQLNLDEKTQALIAIGGSIAANCIGCLEKTVSMAMELGIEENEIGAAIDIGRRVRAGAAAKLDEFARSMNVGTASSAVAKNEGCGC